MSLPQTILYKYTSPFSHVFGSQIAVFFFSPWTVICLYGDKNKEKRKKKAKTKKEQKTSTRIKGKKKKKGKERKNGFHGPEKSVR